jgi:large subunit ribosomal protein L25
MPKTHTLTSLTLEARDAAGTTTAKGLRKAGKIPAVVYGHGNATPVTVDAKALTELILSGNRSHIVNATIAGTKDSVLIRRIETEPLTRKPLSVDFQRVTKNEAITASVTVVATGNPRGVREQGAILDVVTHALEVKGPAQSIPDHLEVDVTALGAHEHIVASQVTLPKGFTLITPPDTVVISCETNRAAAALEAAAEAEIGLAAETPETAG